MFRTENGMKKNLMKLGLVSLLCFGIGVCLSYSVAWGQTVSHFSVSPIGDPAENVPGQVQVGLETNTIEIAARDDQGNLVGDFSGKVFLSQVTDYGPLLGADNEVVYREFLGLTEEEFEDYSASGVIG